MYVYIYRIYFPKEFLGFDLFTFRLKDPKNILFKKKKQQFMLPYIYILMSKLKIFLKKFDIKSFISFHYASLIHSPSSLKAIYYVFFFIKMFNSILQIILNGNKATIVPCLLSKNNIYLTTKQSFIKFLTPAYRINNNNNQNMDFNIYKY